MNILVLGANGLIGSNVIYTLRHFSRHSANLIGMIRNNAKENFHSSDIEKIVIKDYFAELGDLLKQRNFDFVINCVGIVSQNFFKHDSCEVIKWNSYFPHYLAKICELNEQRLIHISTDCVFGKASGENFEDSLKLASDQYGMSKYVGEVHSDCCRTIRLSTIGFEHATHKHGLLEWLFSAKGEEVEGFENAIYSGTSGSEVFRIIDYLISNWEVSRTLHFEGYPISKYELLELLNKAFNLGINVKPVPLPVIRRNLKSKFVGPAELGLPSWRTQIENLAKMRKFYER